MSKQTPIHWCDRTVNPRRGRWPDDLRVREIHAGLSSVQRAARVDSSKANKSAVNDVATTSAVI